MQGRGRDFLAVGQSTQCARDIMMSHRNDIITLVMSLRNTGFFGKTMVKSSLNHSFAPKQEHLGVMLPM